MLSVKVNRSPRAFQSNCACKQVSQRTVVCNAQRQNQPKEAEVASRRAVLSGLACITPALQVLQLTALSEPAHADYMDAFRQLYRPEIDPQQAVVIMMDARSTLREIQGLAVTPMDSQERFQARAVWPAYAKRLRAVQEAAPVVASIITGSDKESTLSEYYGGKGSGGAAVTDAVYQSLGKVLTISGRTIRDEAQAAPDAAKEAELAVDEFLKKVPVDLSDKAMEFRKARAAAVAAK